MANVLRDLRIPLKADGNVREEAILDGADQLHCDPKSILELDGWRWDRRRVLQIPTNLLHRILEQANLSDGVDLGMLTQLFRESQAHSALEVLVVNRVERERLVHSTLGSRRSTAESDGPVS